MLRDKDYLITKDDLVFNVIGYDHASDRATANLKYVQNRKWTAGYQSAVAFLRAENPANIDASGLIAVPHDTVAQIHRPQEGLCRIRSRSRRSHLEQTAIELAEECSEFLEIPLERFGVTDSLLWGRGTNDSDVDLVVYGSHNAAIVLDRMEALFDRPEFERLTIDNFTRGTIPRGIDIQALCRRKFNKGLYRGVRFSLRAVRDYEEIEQCKPYREEGTAEIVARVTDNSESLFFPIIYRLDCGFEAMSFLMHHEALFRVGQRLSTRGNIERGERNRIVIGSLNGREHNMEVVADA
jgi:predicted nucleotidyltransferase